MTIILSCYTVNQYTANMFQHYLSSVYFIYHYQTERYIVQNIPLTIMIRNR